MGNPKGHLVHGLYHTPLHGVWSVMKQRCKNPNNRAYRWYGGKGVKVCPEWELFEPFYKWAVGNGYEKGLTLDRIDPAGDYTPSNCRWVDWKCQQNNKTSNHILTLNGESHTLTEWSEITGIKRTTLYFRLRSGWDIERVLTLGRGGRSG